MDTCFKYPFYEMFWTFFTQKLTSSIYDAEMSKYVTEVSRVQLLPWVNKTETIHALS
jgi:hypothetical protein